MGKIFVSTDNSSEGIHNLRRMHRGIKIHLAVLSIDTQIHRQRKSVSEEISEDTCERSPPHQASEATQHSPVHQHCRRHRAEHTLKRLSAWVGSGGGSGQQRTPGGARGPVSSVPGASCVCARVCVCVCVCV